MKPKRDKRDKQLKEQEEIRLLCESMLPNAHTEAERVIILNQLNLVKATMDYLKGGGGGV